MRLNRGDNGQHCNAAPLGVNVKPNRWRRLNSVGGSQPASPPMPANPEEHVLVAPTELLHQLGYFQGFHDRPERYLHELLKPENVQFRPRSLMEQDPSFQQLIPYVLFQHTNTEGQTCLFRYTRGKGQGEARLHSKRSLGVGGHIDSQDAASDDPYTEGMRRELQEEVRIESEYSLRCVGLIKDDRSEVGQVHLGIVHVAELSAPHVWPRESELVEAGFLTVAEVWEDWDSLETWSQISLEALFPR